MDKFLPTFENKLNNNGNVTNGIDNLLHERSRSPSPTHEITYSEAPRINSNLNQLLDNAVNFFEYSFNNEEKPVLPILKENVYSTNNNTSLQDKKVNFTIFDPFYKTTFMHFRFLQKPCLKLTIRI